MDLKTLRSSNIYIFLSPATLFKKKKKKVTIYQCGDFTNMSSLKIPHAHHVRIFRQIFDRNEQFDKILNVRGNGLNVLKFMEHSEIDPKIHRANVKLIFKGIDAHHP